MCSHLHKSILMAVFNYRRRQCEKLNLIWMKLCGFSYEASTIIPTVSTGVSGFRAVSSGSLRKSQKFARWMQETSEKLQR